MNSKWTEVCFMKPPAVQNVIGKSNENFTICDLPVVLVNDNCLYCISEEFMNFKGI